MNSTPESTAATSIPAHWDISDESAEGAALTEAEVAEQLIFLLQQLGISLDTEVSVSFVDPEPMAELKAEWLDEHAPTDVLSFPMDELSPGAHTQPLVEIDPDRIQRVADGAEVADEVDLADEMVMPAVLGDLVLCPEVVRHQAQQAGHSEQAEYELLITHGVLHLLGYDHAEPAEHAEMFALQDELLERWRSRSTAASSFRSGFVAVVGRPNVGKSTLLNALVGEKVVITSDKPQTTRHVVRGIVQRPDAQLILVDTPGLHRPRTLLGERLNDQVHAATQDVDVVLFCVSALESIGVGDRFIATELAKNPRQKLFAIVTKTDVARPEQIVERLVQLQELAQELGITWVESVPISSVAGTQLELLQDLLIDQLPEGPSWFDPRDVTDASLEQRIAEIVREAALAGVREELPHSIAVLVNEIEPRDDRPADKPLTDVYVDIFVERESQKGMVIGAKGARLRDVGTKARPQIAQLLGTPVYLNLKVRVAKEWQRDPKLLNRLGFPAS